MVLRTRLLVWTFCLLALPSASHATRAPRTQAAPVVAAPTLRTRLSALKPWGRAKVPGKLATHDSLGERAMDVIARSTGNPRYIALFGGSMLAWMGWNALSGNPIDPLPFVGLNTFISLSTWTQQGFLQMTQNRQAALDRVRDAVDRSRDEKDHRVNLKAEREVRQLDATMKARFDQMQLQIEQLTALVQSLKTHEATQETTQDAKQTSEPTASK